MADILKLSCVDRPDEVALITAIENAISDIAVGKMTVCEVLGVLDYISKSIYSNSFS